jgi:hypothetical protein
MTVKRGMMEGSCSLLRQVITIVNINHCLAPCLEFQLQHQPTTAEKSLRDDLSHKQREEESSHSEDKSKDKSSVMTDEGLVHLILSVERSPSLQQNGNNLHMATITSKVEGSCSILKTTQTRSILFISPCFEFQLVLQLAEGETPLRHHLSDKQSSKPAMPPETINKSLVSAL